MIFKAVYPLPLPSPVSQEEEEINEQEPVGRSGHRIVATENHIYSVGGFNPSLGDINDVSDVDEQIGEQGHPCLLKEIWKFNLSTNKWLQIDDYCHVPPTIASHTVASVGRWMFLHGGTAIPFGETPSNVMYRYDLEGHKRHAFVKDEDTLPSHWATIPVEGDIPEARYGHSMTLKFPDLYIFGGTSGYMYSSDVYHLDLRSPVGKWTKLSFDGDGNQPVGRYRHETAFDGERLFVFGGGTDRDAFSLSHIHTFNINTRLWSTIVSHPDPVHKYPEPRKCHSSCQLGSDVYICGGVSGLTILRHRVSKTFTDIWRFSLTSGVWSKCPVTLPQPLYFHASTAIPDKGLMVIFGGVTTDSEQQTCRTNCVYTLQVGVATLKEAAWAVVCEMAGTKLDADELFDLGVPTDLVARLKD